MFSIEEVLKKLSEKGRLFTSERDFQVEMAMAIHELYDYGTQVWCECPLVYKDEKIKRERRCHIDIVVMQDGNAIPIELKYRTKSCEIRTALGEKIRLKSHLAYDDGCIGFANDIKRVHDFKIANSTRCKEGYAVFLTNDEVYKNPVSPQRTVDYSTIWINSLSAGEYKPQVNGIKREVVIPSFIDSSWYSFQVVDEPEFFYKYAKV